MITKKITYAMAIAKEYHDKAGQVGYFEKHIMRCYEIAVTYFMYGCPDTRSAYEEQNKNTYKVMDTEELRNFVINFNEAALIAVILHDILEDTEMTYEKLSELFGYDIAYDVFCVTDEKGVNRKEKKLNTYHKIRSSEVAITVKLIDRVCNVEQSSGNEPKDRNYLNMYMKEYYSFKCALWGGPMDDRKWLWDLLDTLHGFSFKK